MTTYFRPIAQTDAARPEGALPLAGNPIVWFSQVEALTRGQPSRLVDVVDMASDDLSALTAPRADVAGLGMSAPKLMGVLNTTPDSFSDGGRFTTTEAAVVHARRMVEEGAHILDIGGESTRPGAAFVPVDEEIARTAPVIAALKAARIDTPVSIDTRKAQVARAAVQAGASLLNDVSALSFDAQMADAAARSGAPICLMHAQGDPKTMQENPSYDDVLLDVYDYLAARVVEAKQAGIEPQNIIVDPGIGFGKTPAHNLALIRGLSLFHGLGCPILLGVSRKRFIGSIGSQPQADKRAPGSVAIALQGLMQGVQIIRAHDIEEHAQAFALWHAVNDNKQD